MKLSERLQVIADYIPKNSIVADIGTDHGYIPIYLIENYISKKVIATDISSGSLSKAEENIERYNHEDRISTRLGNGLDVIKEFEVDTVIISGMGGILIKDILDKDRKIRDSISNYILQSNIATDKLRKYLLENGFQILDEKLVKDSDKYYEVLFVKKGLSDFKEGEFYQIGDSLIENRDPLLEEFINHRISLNKDILAKIDPGVGGNIEDRIGQIEDEIREYEEVLRKIEG